MTNSEALFTVGIPNLAALAMLIWQGVRFRNTMRAFREEGAKSSAAMPPQMLQGNRQLQELVARIEKRKQNV